MTETPNDELKAQIEQTLKNNSALWHLTSDSILRQKLENTNEYIRQFYNIK